MQACQKSGRKRMTKIETSKSSPRNYLDGVHIVFPIFEFIDIWRNTSIG